MFKFFIFALITSSIVTASSARSAIFSVVDYGAIGDGHADDTKVRNSDYHHCESNDLQTNHFSGITFRCI